MEAGGLIGRRRLLSVLGAGAAALAAGPLWTSPSTALAGEDGCAGDPVLLIDLGQIDITVSVPTRVLPLMSMKDPVIMRVTVPTNVKGMVLLDTTALGVTRLPQRVDFVYSGYATSFAECTLTVELHGPDLGKANAYAMQYWITSLLEQKSGSVAGGTWFKATHRVPRLNPTAPLIQPGEPRRRR